MTQVLICVAAVVCSPLLSIPLIYTAFGGWWRKKLYTEVGIDLVAFN